MREIIKRLIGIILPIVFLGQCVIESIMRLLRIIHGIEC